MNCMADSKENNITNAILGVKRLIQLFVYEITKMITSGTAVDKHVTVC